LDKLRNKRISSFRSPVERCFSFIKIVFRSGHEKFRFQVVRTFRKLVQNSRAALKPSIFVGLLM
jgi:hypothetical protein